VKEVKVKASEKALSILKREEEAVRETLHIQKINYSVGKRLSASLG
jgi:hypothetical protein